MAEVLFWGAVLRTAQLAVEASTTLLVGLLVAGVMRRMLGAAGTRRLFGGPGWKGLLRAWAVGTLLPVCALGVIPIARELRRAGVPGGTIVAFVLAAPHINPLSLLYGLTLSEPLVIVSFAAGSLLVALAAGAAWDRFFARPGDDPIPDDEPTPAPGLKRLAAVAVTAAREAVGPAMAYALLGLLATGLLAAALPFGCLSTTMKHDDPLSPLLMTVVALPAYSGPLPGMMRLGLMFEHGNSVGAAFVLFELGIGVNVGLLAWLGWTFGVRRMLAWLAPVVVLVLALAYAAERPLYFAREEAGHTHAFDEWANPFPSGSTVSPGEVWHKLTQKVEVLEPVALAGLALLVLLGLGERLLDRRGALEAFLLKAPPVADGPTSVWNRPLPGPVLGLAALLGLVVFSVMALYVYYPAPGQAFAEMSQVRAEALTAAKSGHREEAVRQIRYWDLLTRKLQVGALLRHWRLDPATGQSAEELRERLEDLRDALLAGDDAAVKGLVLKVEEAYRLCHEAYAGLVGPTEPHS